MVCLLDFIETKPIEGNNLKIAIKFINEECIPNGIETLDQFINVFGTIEELCGYVTKNKIPLRMLWNTIKKNVNNMPKSDEVKPDKVKPKFKVKVPINPSDNDDAVAHQNKSIHGRTGISAIVKPGQSGKTGISISHNSEAEALFEVACLSANNKENRRIVINICDNNLLLVKQTSSRWKNEVTGKKVVTFGSDCDNKTANEIIGGIVAKETDIIFCCSNSKRFDDITYIIKTTQSMGFHYTIYIDEADKGATLKFRGDMVKSWAESSEIVFITATPKKLIEVYGPIDLYKIPGPDHQHYLRIAECYHFQFEGNCSEYEHAATNYVHAYFSENMKPKIGDVWFIPAGFKQVEHEEMRDYLFDPDNDLFNAVLMLNGKNKEFVLRFKNAEGEIISEKKTIKSIDGSREQELSSWLEKYYIENKGAAQWKLAVTGNLCIGRGITFQSERCSFSHAIIAPNISKSNKYELYQIFCRMCGPIKKFKRFIESGSPTIICEDRTWKSVCGAEKTIYSISRQAAKGGAVLDDELYLTADGMSKARNVLFCGVDMAEPYRSKDPEPFKTLDDARNWIESVIGRKYKYKHTNYEECISNGVSWLLSKKNGTAHADTPRYKVSWSELLRYGGGGGVSKKTPVRITPCYLDVNNPNSLRWSVVIYHKSDQEA